MNKELLQQALDALLGYKPHSLTHAKEQGSAIVALRAAIAQPEQPSYLNHADWYAKCNMVEALQDKVYALDAKCEALTQAIVERDSIIKQYIAQLEQPTPAKYAQGYAEGFNDACKPIAQPEQPEGDANDSEMLDFIDAASGTIRSDVLFGGLIPRYVHWGEGQTVREAIRAAFAQPEQPAACKKCGGEMAPGQAIAQTSVGTNDFINDKTVCTWSFGGPGKLVSCMKCKQ